MADISALLGAAGIGGVIGKAIVQLELSTAKYQAELRAAQGETATSAGAISKGLGGISSAWVAIGAVAVAGVAASVKAASDLNEQINRAGEVFEGATGKVIKFSESTAEGLGIAQSESLEATSNFGQLLLAAGFASDAAADMGIEMTKLGADLGSFNNIPVAEALEKIRAGLAGQARPLREVGVFLSAARVESEAYASGIAKQGEELTDAQKIQARYNIILQDTTQAQGDFQRTVGESLPNQMKVLQARLTDLAATVGEDLVPSLVELVGVLQDVLDIAEKIGSVVPNTKNAIAELGGSLAEPGTEGAREATKALIDFNGVVEQTGAGTARVAEGIEKTTQTYKDMDGTVHNLILTYQLFNDGSKLLISTQEDAGKAIEKTHKAVHQFLDMTDQEIEDWRNDTVEAFHDTIFVLKTTEDASGETEHSVIKSLKEMKSEAKDMASTMREISREKWINDEFVAFMTEQAPEFFIDFGNLNEKQQRQAQQLWKETTDQSSAYEAALGKITGVLQSVDNKTTKHTVQIHYEYVGFDPSKPGMSDTRTGRGGQQ